MKTKQRVYLVLQLILPLAIFAIDYYFYHYYPESPLAQKVGVVLLNNKSFLFWLVFSNLITLVASLLVKNKDSVCFLGGYLFAMSMSCILIGIENGFFFVFVIIYSFAAELCRSSFEELDEK